VTDNSLEGNMLYPVEILDLGCLDYLETHDLQRDLVAERSADRIQDTLILVEHPEIALPVIVATGSRHDDEAPLFGTTSQLDESLHDTRSRH